ncbi:uncharacterized protein DNG_07284 [Cephalotrichum gorgonifer]|uniref:P-loop containing nucleoside triphosphate hydrolase protein n=1 Tax=Cephalotrichum gorgonifer TaxID=2041049 RepID=A0AAE8N346_9PEZI|nr:uncharacterized protein DNG_07284 [Cephalotrichum gorgonifer]
MSSPSISLRPGSVSRPESIASEHYEDAGSSNGSQGSVSDSEPTSYSFESREDSLDNDGGKATVVKKEPGEDVTPEEDPVRPKNLVVDDPFQSEENRILFEAIDFIQSSDLKHHVEIPELVVIGEQSTGKSSLLQALIDIPFPVGTGCCTRFATRVVSERTPPGTKSRVKIRIEAPQTPIPEFGEPEECPEYEFAAESLSADEFDKIIKEARIKAGGGRDSKNFSAFVLRIELSGPHRSYFNILDLPGMFSWARGGIRREEMDGVTKMVLQYIQNPKNILVCVADAVIDIDRQQIFEQVATHLGRRNGVVGVLTKCDMLRDPQQTIDVVLGNHKGADQDLDVTWFTVRNPLSTDVESHSVVEEKLFTSTPWSRLPPSSRGTTALKKKLSTLLCSALRESFPTIRASLASQLEALRVERQSLGEPKTTYRERLNWLSSLVGEYEKFVRMAFENPGRMGTAEMAVRRWATAINEDFAKYIRSHGETYRFEYEDVDPNELLQEAQTWWNRKFRGWRSVDPSLPPVPSPFRQKRTSPPRPNINPPGLGLKPVHDPKSCDEFMEVISTEINKFSTPLPGLIDPDVLKSLFWIQTERWLDIAGVYFGGTIAKVLDAARGILHEVCPPTGSTAILHQELEKLLRDMHNTAATEFISEVRSFFNKQRDMTMQTTNPNFLKNVRTWGAIRALKALDTDDLEGKNPLDAPDVLFGVVTRPRHQDLAEEIHDFTKVYYIYKRDHYIQHTTSDIVETFLQSPKGALRGLSSDYVKRLSEDEVFRLTREDRDTVKRRAVLNKDIQKRERALEMTREAEDWTIAQL